MSCVRTWRPRLASPWRTELVLKAAYGNRRLARWHMPSRRNEGTGPKTDLPIAERDQIQAVNQQAAREEQSVDRRAASGTQTLLLHACPLSGPIGGLTAWTMTRVRAVQGFRLLQLGLGVLLALMVLMAAWLGRALLVWGRHVRGIQGALQKAGSGGIPTVRRTGERELDQIIDALNEAGLRVGEARLQADAMS